MFLSKASFSQCGNLWIFMHLRFYVKSTKRAYKTALPNSRIFHEINFTKFPWNQSTFFTFSSCKLISRLFRETSELMGFFLKPVSRIFQWSLSMKWEVEKFLNFHTVLPFLNLPRKPNISWCVFCLLDLERPRIEVAEAF